MNVADLAHHIDARFPFSAAAPWDPVGIQIGWPDKPAGSVAVCHEVTDAVATRAERDRIDTIVTYHPLLFTPTQRLVAAPSAEGRALRLARNGTSLVVVHTALDAADPGTGNAALTHLGFATSGAFGADDADAAPLGRYAVLDSPVDTAAMLVLLEGRLATPIRVADSGTSIRRLGILPGSGSSFLAEAAEVVDAVVTGDVSHHRASDARARGLTVFDAGHSATERPGIAALYAAVCTEVPTAVHWDDDPTPWER